MENKKNWGLIKKTKLKNWIFAEYSNYSENLDKSKTILIYTDKPYCNWRVWIGRTDGKGKGRYYSFLTKKNAIVWTNKYMRTHK